MTDKTISDQAAGEPDWSHPKLQALISRNARMSLQLGIIEDLIDDPEHEYDTDGDYASAVTDKVHAFIKASRSTAPTTGSATVAMPIGWKLSVHESDGRSWLTVRHPQGAKCSLSAAATIDEGRSRTIAAQVLDELGKALCAPPANAPVASVPANVIAALDRMGSPLHESRLSGVTAQEDASCMKLIRDHVMSAKSVYGTEND